MTQQFRERYATRNEGRPHFLADSGGRPHFLADWGTFAPNQWEPGPDSLTNYTSAAHSGTQKR